MKNRVSSVSSPPTSSSDASSKSLSVVLLLIMTSHWSFLSLCRSIPEGFLSMKKRSFEWSDVERKRWTGVGAKPNLMVCKVLWQNITQQSFGCCVIALWKVAPQYNGSMRNLNRFYSLNWVHINRVCLEAWLAPNSCDEIIQKMMRSSLRYEFAFRWGTSDLKLFFTWHMFKELHKLKAKAGLSFGKLLVRCNKAFHAAKKLPMALQQLTTIAQKKQVTILRTCHWKVKAIWAGRCRTRVDCVEFCKHNSEEKGKRENSYHLTYVTF